MQYLGFSGFLVTVEGLREQRGTATRSLLFSLVLLISNSAAIADATLVRFPSSSRNAIAFVAHGDLWTAPPAGGRAARLVHGAGSIVTARLSPNGRWIAYTERARGGQDVYVVATSGGAPHRLTFDARAEAEANLVTAWTPDSRDIVFLSNRGAWAFEVLRAYSVPATGGAIRALPLDVAGSMSFSPDGGSVAYTRTFNDLDSRKRNTGGQAEDVFTYDLAARRLTRITDWKGTDTDPMWFRRRIYFVSDRSAGFRANIWCYDLDTRVSHEVTHFVDYDVDVPTLGGDRILFQQGGKVWALKLPNEQLRELAVEFPDDGERTASRMVSVGVQVRAKDVTGAVDYALTPDGISAVMAAHGDLFSVALPGGSARDLTMSPGVDEDHPAVSPDGRSVAYVTEAEGAQQIALRPLAGGPEKMLTHFKSGVFYSPLFSTDGDWLAIADAEHDLWLLSLRGGQPKRIAFDPNAEIRDAAFSSDGHWLAYSTLRSTGLTALHLYDLRGCRDAVVSGELEADRLPTFAPNSAVLYFVSKRNELPFTTDRGDEATLSSLNSDGVYAVTLGASVDDLMARAVRLRVTPGRIVSLQARGADLLYEARPPALVGGEMSGQSPALHALDITTGRDRVLLSDMDREVVSADGTLALFQRHGEWRVIDLPPGGVENVVSLEDLRLQIDPHSEWREMFEHAWRLDRDLFFSRVMNGTDWNAVHDAYVKLLPELGSREDFLYLLRQLQGELATSHAFIGGLDADDPSPPIHTPRLGVDLQLELSTGRYRLAHIYAGDPTRDRFRSPLTTPTLEAQLSPARDGDYVLAVDGRELRAPADIDALLYGHQGDVELSISASAKGVRRTIQVTPVADDFDLHQYEWVETNRRKVSDLSGGRIGYIFVSDFEELGAEDLLRQLQGQISKDGLVIDIRWNRGGHTSQAVLDLLRRVRAGAFVNREGGVEPLPLFTVPRSMAVMINSVTSSDGDQFAYFFKQSGLGPLVGERTWGGVQGIKGPWPLMDGARITIPKDSLASTDSQWLIENAGVSPDIPVSRDPDEVDTGRDSQLQAAVQAVLAQMQHRRATLSAPSPLPAYPAQGNVPGASFESSIESRH
jgi:tricorn protease